MGVTEPLYMVAGILIGAAAVAVVWAALKAILSDR